MVSPENTNWLYDYGFEDIAVHDGNFAAHNSGFSWPMQALNGSSNASCELLLNFDMSSCFLSDAEAMVLMEDNDTKATFTSMLAEVIFKKEAGSKKRCRTEPCAPSSSKACREKQRRDRLNDKFMELGALLEPGRPPKTDKAAVLVDRMVTQLRGEAQKLKDSNLNLQEKIKELKAEKNELRDEKQRLKAEKEKLEQQLKTINTHNLAFCLQPSQLHLLPKTKVQANWCYPGVAMWQFMPPAAVDTSQDHVLRPPVA
ncbi:Transcription factor ILR3 [Sesamum angolense]|uniref:Transcription factor ILR3 n=1 Tax=Sesamum angolense TaxID=2727404 RepID=A0AAE1W5I2_9LAMI|nr:Transcription factor ILR3 [Sesamum angolense]